MEKELLYACTQGGMYRIVDGKVEKMNPDTSNDCVYVIKSWGISNLEGKLLTLLDASINDTIQRDALKGLMRQMLWGSIHEINNADYFTLVEKMPNQLVGTK